MPQWSTAMTITFCLYLVFILVVLTISFPLKSHGKSDIGGSIERSQSNSIFNVDNDIGDDEQKLLQRANDLPIFSNRSEVLRVAFNK